MLKNDRQNTDEGNMKLPKDRKIFTRITGPGFIQLSALARKRGTTMSTLFRTLLEEGLLIAHRRDELTGRDIQLEAERLAQSVRIESEIDE